MKTIKQNGKVKRVRGFEAKILIALGLATAYTPAPKLVKPPAEVKPRGYQRRDMVAAPVYAPVYQVPEPKDD